LSTTALVWFRRDLRVHDHPALNAAIDRCDRVVPVFCFDDRLLHGRHASGPRAQFLLECLADLDRSLGARDAGLVIRRGRPERELRALAEETGAREVHFTQDVSPFARERGESAAPAFAGAGLEVHAHPGLGVIDAVGSPRTQTGKAYTVFTPYYRAWSAVERRPVLDPPSGLAMPSKLRRGDLPTLADLGLEQEVDDPAPGGEAAARERLEQFMRSDVRSYGSEHDNLATDRTSRLSPYLHFGCLSPLEVEHRAPGGKGPEAFIRQLCWRDFYHQLLLHHPRNARSEFQQRYRGSLRWSYAQRRFEAWAEGRTGFPLVDAGMRQLRREGWMHNRARLVVGSFLTKDLGIDWRWGERWFMRLLIDGDEANNNGNWQWIASVGADPQPVFRRIYNPARHMERYDPDGDYVRRYVPELRAVPDEHLREPWKMPAETQGEVGCVIGEDYPEPIVDHAQARRETLARYAEGRSDR
jgi:deoxyribodipyrimidine photo-lyase